MLFPGLVWNLGGRIGIGILELITSLNGRKLIYPQDQNAGCSWIALKDNGDSTVLLNGAFIRHERQSAYRKSRGLIFLALVENNNPYQQFASIDLIT